MPNASRGGRKPILGKVSSVPKFLLDANLSTPRHDTLNSSLPSGLASGGRGGRTEHDRARVRGGPATPLVLGHGMPFVSRSHFPVWLRQRGDEPRRLTRSVRSARMQGETSRGVHGRGTRRDAGARERSGRRPCAAAYGQTIRRTGSARRWRCSPRGRNEGAPWASGSMRSSPPAHPPSCRKWCVEARGAAPGRPATMRMQGARRDVDHPV